MRCAVYTAIHGHSPLFADVPVARLSRRKQGFESPRERQSPFVHFDFSVAAPVGSPWMWTLAFGHHEDRTPTGMTWDPDNKDRTALHEAGHAVVAWSFGVTVGCIHLDLENKSGHTMVASTAHLQPFEQIAQCLAGFEAEQAFQTSGQPKQGGL
jgi:hypothetical protein